MKILFLMDPLETVVMKKDTSFFLMLGAHEKGHEVFYLPSGGISSVNGKLQFEATKVIPQQVEEKPFIIEESLTLDETNIDAVFIRTDPPFDAEYLLNTWLLEQLPSSIPVLNSPKGIRTVNEKIWVTQFSSIIPNTLVSRNKDQIYSFFEQEGNVVVKPTDGHGGKSIFHIQKGQPNVHVILETITDHWQKEVIVQDFIPESKTGDKRVLLLNGEPLGAVLRVHAEDDHRNNFFSGGEPVKSEITESDRKLIDVIKPHLKELGLYFVGIDVMGNYLTEVNVTSPTCLQEMARLDNHDYKSQVVEFLEKLVEEKKSPDTIAT